MRHWLNVSVSNNDSTTFDTALDPKEVFTSSELTLIRFLYGFLGLMGCIENIAVIFTILTNALLLDVPSNWFVLGLAIADGMVSLLAFPPCINSLITPAVLRASVQMVILLSAGNLFLLTFNRFLSVYNSLKYPSCMTLGRAKLLILASWIAAIFLLALTWLSILADVQKLFYISILYYTAITISTTGLNVYMFTKARHQRKAIRKLRNSVISRQHKTRLKESSLFLRLLVVAITSIASSIPNIVIFNLYPTKNRRQTRSFQRIITWVYLVVLINAVVDPFVYFFDRQQFNRFLTTLKRRILRRNAVADLHLRKSAFFIPQKYGRTGER